jgi:hypothetical protein
MAAGAVVALAQVSGLSKARANSSSISCADAAAGAVVHVDAAVLEVERAGCSPS